MDLHLLHTKPGHLIRRCHQIVVGLFLEGCGSLGVTPVQYAVLRSLAATPGVDQIMLAGLAALDRTSTSRIILALQRRGLLARERDPKDARVRRLRLTKAGTALLDRVEPIVAASQDAFMAPLAPAQREAFIAALATLAAAHNHASRAPLRLVPEPMRQKAVPKPADG